MAPSKHNEEQKHCILFFEKEGVFIGGGNMKIGYDTEIKTSIIWSNPIQTDAYVGVQLCIPTRKEPGISSMRSRSAAQIVDTLNIKIKFTKTGFLDIKGTPGKETVLATNFTKYLPDNEDSTKWTAVKLVGRRPVVEGFPLPFIGDEPYHSWVNLNAPIKGGITLRQLCFETAEICALVKVPDWVSKLKTIKSVVRLEEPFSYPVFSSTQGSLHWSMDRYRLEHADTVCKDLPQYTEMFSQTKFQHTAVILTQGVVQDVFRLNEDCDAMRDEPIQARYIRHTKDEDRPGQQIYAIMNLPEKFLTRFQRALDREVKLGAKVEVAFTKRPEKEVGKPMPPDDNTWQGIVASPTIPGLEHGENFVVLLRRPGPVMVPGDMDASVQTKSEIMFYDTVEAFLKIEPNLNPSKRQVAGIVRLVFEKQLRNELTATSFDDIDYNTVDLVDPVAIPLAKGTPANEETPLNSDANNEQEAPHTSTAGMTKQAWIEQLVFEQRLQRELIQGNNLETLVLPYRIEPRSLARGPRTPGNPTANTPSDSIDSAIVKLSDLQISNDSPEGSDIILQVDFLDTKDNDYREMLLSSLGSEFRQRTESYLHKVPCGILGVAGFGGAGKTHLISTLTNVCLDHPRLNKILLYSFGNGATSSVLGRSRKINIETVDTFNKAYPSKPREYAIMVRGYNPATELQKVIDIASGGDPNQPGEFTDAWKMPLSLAEWTLKVVCFDDYYLDPLESRKLHSLREQFRAIPAYAPLGRFFKGKSAWKDIVSEWRATGKDDNPPDPGLNPTLLLHNLMKTIVLRADILAVTAHTSQDDPYWSFTRDVAKLSVADEAGAMSVPLSLLGWPRFRAWLLAGDERQLAPTVMTLFDKEDGDNWVNKFGRHLRISILERLRRNGWPAIVMNVQNRIVRGGFDAALEVFYSDVDDFKYGERCAVEHHPKAVIAEQWITRKFPSLVTQLPQGNILPVFIQCQGKCEVDGSTRSRKNTEQASKTILLILEMVDASGGKIKPGDIGIISPYKAMNTHIVSLLDGHPSLKDHITVSTTDSFRGQERAFIFYVMTAERETTTGHVANRQRSVVGITRHMEFLCVVGGIETGAQDRKKTTAVNEDGAVEVVDLGSLKTLLEWFKTKKRVATTPRSDWGKVSLPRRDPSIATETRGFGPSHQPSNDDWNSNTNDAWGAEDNFATTNAWKDLTSEQRGFGHCVPEEKYKKGVLVRGSYEEGSMW
ncbi:DNA helicase [Colletotrichum tofieldiae]|nr:DNA helicase [Colletotrichum tofieldiae]